MIGFEHGGNLQQAEKYWSKPARGWLDLSTGISPWVYPVPAVPDSVWRSLPYPSESLRKAAAIYYQCSPKAVTPVNGSQEAITLLPQLLRPARVAIPAMGYREHEQAWSAAGHHVVYYRHWSELLLQIQHRQVDHVVVINPNNPTTELLSLKQMLYLHEQLQERGYLIIDEAFMDSHGQQHLPSLLNLPKVIVLRSLGKFFGLAGVRLGFVLGEGLVVDELRQRLLLWGVNRPAQWLGTQALIDRRWQQQQRKRIATQSQQLLLLLHRLHWGECKSAGLFITVNGDRGQLESIFERAGEAGLLLRYQRISGGQAWLRVGLPGKHILRLQQFLQQMVDYV